MHIPTCVVVASVLYCVVAFVVVMLLLFLLFSVAVDVVFIGSFVAVACMV